LAVPLRHAAACERTVLLDAGCQGLLLGFRLGLGLRGAGRCAFGHQLAWASALAPSEQQGDAKEAGKVIAISNGPAFDA
jgi:hypothetical protein